MDIDVSEAVRYPSLSRPRDRGTKVTKRLRPPTLIPPLTFYDRHLAENHRLKKVERFPQFIPYLHQAEVRLRGSFGLADATLSRSEVRTVFDRLPDVHDAYTAAMAYQATEAQHATMLASSLLLRSKSPARFISVSWEQLNRSQWSIIERNTAFIEDFGLRIKGLAELKKWTLDKMDEESREILRGMKQGLSALAFWEIFCMSSETKAVLKDFDVLFSDPFNDDKCRTKGFTSVPVTTPFHLDATTTAWGLPISSMCPAAIPTIKPRRNFKTNLVTLNCTLNNLRSQQRLRQFTTHKPVPPALNIVTSSYLIMDSWSNIIIPRRAPAKSMAGAFLLRAWARAVEHDTTFIIFRWGDNFERIAFRHRANQTLYISDLIDLSSCPLYRNLQTGLYLSIVHDASERVIRQKYTEESSSHRTRSSHGQTSRRRYNTRLAASIGTKEAQVAKCIKDHADNRSLALLEIRYDVYNSPVPASFVRVGTKRKRSYGADEYFKLILTSEIASGATGVVHDALLEVQVGGYILPTDIVVKLAFAPEEIESMRHEFSIYEHLTSRGVEKGIPLVFGLFEDVETDAMAIVMNHVGKSLWDLRTDLNSIQVRVSASVRDAYLGIMSNIHEAGVRHCDLRPENLMLADDETVTIIDFDQATINTSTAAKKREIRLLEDLLEGGVLYDSRR